ncbi:S8 family serine peptidase, partial [Hyalangium sp.]|uniref:S8 family serine peptidase n=1 Tax=Hyalangium sp. TaxID=2028555 RepID=UPI002D721D2C
MRRILANAVVALAVVATAACSSRDEAPTSIEPSAQALDLADAELVPGGIVVDFKDGTSEEQFDAWEAEWGVDVEFNSIESADDGLTVAVGVDDVESALERIRQHPAVESAEPLLSFRSSFTPNDPEYSKQWNLQMIDMPKAWDGSKGKGVVVAVLDTGIAYEDYDDFKQVPDLKGAKFVKGYDFVNDDEHANDDHGHGTHVAGTIA